MACFRSKLARFCGLAFLSLALFSIAGGHWAVLQTVAWAQMLRDYSENATVAEAVEKTFSGEAPCKMCISIVTEKQKEEKAPATVKAEKKGETFLPAARDLLPLPTEGEARHFPAGLFAGPVRYDSPPCPVPLAPLLPLA